MKKICFMLSILLLFAPLLVSCDDDATVSDVELLNLTTNFDTYYSTKHLVCWQDIAAVYAAKYTINKYTYSYALEDTETLIDKAGYVISTSLLKRQGNDISAYQTESFITEIKTYVESGYAALTVKELALCFFAMTASDTEYSYEAAAKHLETLQNDDGGFPVSDDYTYSDVESSAYALNIIMLSRRYITDTCYDDLVVYIRDKINDDNTLSDIENKKSAFTTALTLNSFISAKIPMDGEVSTALTTAINTNFKLENNSILSGYKKYADDTDINREVTGEVLFCFSATAYGNLWTNLVQEDNAESKD